MFGLSIAAYFPFRRIKITSQQVSAEATEAHIQTEPDMRFHPICHGCGIEAVAMDMWDPFIKAVKKKLPNAKIVFDLFHVVANLAG